MPFLDPLRMTPWGEDVLATIITLSLALAWLRIVDAIANQGWLNPNLSRKIIHITTGPLFLCCWPLFSPQPQARYFAALVPLVITGQFLAIGLGWLSDPATVQATTRTGDAREMLKGPLYYGIVFVICTIGWWRSAPGGMVALMMMCGGDGLADIIGRRWGQVKLPFNPDKSWAGSGAMAVASFIFAYGFLVFFNQLGYLHPALNLQGAAAKVVAIALVTTLVEALPLRNIDNLTLTGTALLLSLWWLSG